MSALALRWLEHLHGHLACLSTLALYHPALMLGRAGRQPRTVTIAATGLVTVTAALGVVLYPPYRTSIKPMVFGASLALGNAFERKEHLAIAVVALSWAGLAAHWTAARDRDRSAEQRHLAFVAYAAAAGLATLTAALGIIVAVYKTF
jgi:hypothetical protein